MTPPRQTRRRVLATLGSIGAGTALGATPTSGAGRDAAGDGFRGVARRTYRYFEDFTDETTGLTIDRVDEARGGRYDPATRTSPTNIGMYLLGTVAAVEFGFLRERTALDRIETLLDTLESIETWNGLYYNWYNTDDGSLFRDFGLFVSTVDNGWLTAGLVVVASAFDDLYERATRLADAMDYEPLYDPNVYNPFDPDAPVGQMHGGYDANEGALTAHHYGVFNTEPRVASYLAIGKGDVPREHWWGMFRTFPPEFEWTNQTPEGEFRTYDGISVFEGRYVYDGIEYVPSWGGSMFESLMPALVLKEPELGSNALGRNNERHVAVQRAYARESDLPAWGFSPCALPAADGGYSEFGVDDAGIEGYDDDTYATPHATFLAAEYDPAGARTNLRTLGELGARGRYGFYDSVELASGEVTRSYLALDQGMTIAALANHLEDGVLREYFHAHPFGEAHESLLSAEEFSI
ncbi:glucoamylase family protein [Haloferacaceae archaeon DSL9]